MSDYTVLPIGSVEAGEIGACPHCGKNGLIEVTNGMTFYVHRTGAAMGEKERPIVGWEMCPPIGTPANS